MRTPTVIRHAARRRARAPALPRCRVRRVRRVRRRDNHVFTDIGIYRSTSVNLHALSAPSGDGGAPQRVSAAVATPSLFRALGAVSARGRGLTDADAAPGAPPVVIISQGLWKSTFSSDPAIVGRYVAVDGIDREIVGVMPSGFRFPTEHTALWLPPVLDPAHTNSAAFDYTGIARLRDGATIAAATADLQRLLPQVPVVYPGRLSAAAITATNMRAVVRPLRDVMVGNVARILGIVLAALGVSALPALRSGRSSLAALLLVDGRTSTGTRVRRRARRGHRQAHSDDGHRSLVDHRGERRAVAVRRLVVRGATGDAAIGVAAGLIAAVGVTRGLRTLLLSVSPTDPAALATASALLLLTAVAGSWLPARRAARLDPAIALRGEP